MPSDKFEAKGKCGEPVTGSTWPRGGAIRCRKQGLTHYPKPDSVKELIDYFCSSCKEGTGR